MTAATQPTAPSYQTPMQVLPSCLVSTLSSRYAHQRENRVDLRVLDPRDHGSDQGRRPAPARATARHRPRWTQTSTVVQSATATPPECNSVLSWSAAEPAAAVCSSEQLGSTPPHSPSVPLPAHSRRASKSCPSRIVGSLIHTYRRRHGPSDP